MIFRVRFSLTSFLLDPRSDLVRMPQPGRLMICFGAAGTSAPRPTVKAHDDAATRHPARGVMAMSDQFSEHERAAFYRVIESRHDIHAFRPDPIPEEVLLRVLGAAHHAPSVGLMQPWNFILIHDPATKARVHEVFLRENEAAASNYEGPRA